MDKFLTGLLRVSGAITSALIFGRLAIAQTAAFVPAPTPTLDFVGISPFSANITLTSQYISRGFRQTWGKPALQGGFDYSGPAGFSAGTWLSTVSNRYVEDGTLEWDIYGAYNGSVGDIGYSGALYTYIYPGARYRATATEYNYTEIALGLNYKFLYAKYNATVSKDFFGIENARGTGYLDLGSNIELGMGYSLQLHAGQGRVTNNSMWNWRDYRIGISKTLGPGWSLTTGYTRAFGNTDVYDHYTLGISNSAGVIEHSDPAVGTFVLSISRTF